MVRFSGRSAPRRSSQAGRPGIYLSPMGWGTVFGMCFGIAGMGTSAQAADSVLLTYHEQRTTVPYADLEAFVNTGDLSPAIAPFLQTIPLTASEVQAVFAEEIPDTGIPLGPIDVEFIAIQFSKLLGDPLRRDSRGPMLQALADAYRGDRTITILELVQYYPDDLIRVDLAQLSRVREDVDLYVQRIAVVLRFVEALLPELVCDCGLEAAFTAPEPPVAGEADPVSAKNVYSSAHSTEFIPIPIPDHPVSVTIGQSSNHASAPVPRIARRVIVHIGPLRPSFTINGLTNFAATGATSPGWSFYLDVANLDRDDVRRILTSEFAVDTDFLDTNLNNLLGEYLLFQASRVVHTPSGSADIQALRSALILSALDDNRLSILEVLQNYPSETIVVEGINLARLASNLEEEGAVRTLTRSLEDLLVEFQGTVAAEICNCDHSSSPRTELSPCSNVDH